MRKGFTLIELAIVLVIIGLVVGGVLVGQNLISAAAVRAQVSQIEKFNTAANTFYGKYGYLPGDIPAAPAAQFGFIARGPYEGQGDGNGIIEGNNGNSAGGSQGYFEGCGETSVFWVDLSTAQMIDGSFTTATSTCASWGAPTATTVTLFMPVAKIGGTNYVYVYSGGIYQDGKNYFGIYNATYVSAGVPDFFSSLSVQQAYAIDAKTDDGLPQTGRVTAKWASTWAAAGEYFGAHGASPGTAAVGSATTCYDNGGNASNPMAYSLAQNNGTGVNCALSFQMQAGD